MNKLDTIVFDLGNVLIDWNPDYLFDQVFENDPVRKKFFFERICTEEWHSRQDAGRSIGEATRELAAKYPDWNEPIHAFYGRWREMFRGPIQGSVHILEELKEQSYKLYALTNWNDELFRLALEDFPFLHWFRGIVVSGEEGINKPSPDIYFTLLRKYQIDPAKAVFIDDKLRNVQAAEAAGMVGLQFHSPEQLRVELKKLGCLRP